MADLSAARQMVSAQLDLAPVRLRSVAFEAAPPCARFTLRGGTDLDGTASAFGLDLPREACRASRSGERAALWLGPDEWLLLALDTTDAAGLAAALSAALSGKHHSLVDVSHRNTAFLLSGRQAPAALNAGCPLDLSLGSFPIGMCTRTIFGKAEIVLWRADENSFRIEVWRSFASYVAGLLAVACQDAASLERTRA